jgi:hypothetical protein
VDADPQGQRKFLIGYLTQGEQHPLLIVAHPARHARHQDDLAPVMVDVGPKKADLVPVGCPLHRPYQRVELIGQRGRPRILDHGIGSVEVEEGDGGDAMFGFLTASQQMASDGHRHVPSEVNAGRVRGDDGQLGARTRR